MKYMNILDKLQCLFDMVFSSPVYMTFLMVMLLFIVALCTNIIKRNKIIVMMVISYLVLFIVVIANNSKALSKVFDSISTNLFTNIYFPSTYAYLFIMLVVDIVTITTMLNKKADKSYKVANGICFFSIQFILALIMELIAKNNIDIFAKKSLFGNKKVVMLLESSMNVFIIWILAIIVIYVTNKIADRILAGRVVDNTNTRVNIGNELVVSADEDKLSEEYDDYTTVIPTDYSHVEDNLVQSVDNFDMNNDTIYEDIVNNQYENDNVLLDVSEKDVMVDDYSNLSGEELLNKILNNDFPLIKNTSVQNTSLSVDDEDKKDVSIKEVVSDTVIENKVSNEPVVEIKKDEKDTYTLNDYKIFNKILKDIQRTNNSNIINIDRSLEIRLLMKYPEEEYSLFKGMLRNYSN